MASILITYFSKTGNTEKMAKAVYQGAIKQKSITVILKKVEETTPEDMLNADAIIMGSPVYYGLPSAEVKKLLDESVKYHGKMKGKIGAAFSSSGGFGGGNETTNLAILQAFLIHGMIVTGKAESCHYGPVAVKEPDKNALKECEELGERIAELLMKLKK